MKTRLTVVLQRSGFTYRPTRTVIGLQEQVILATEFMVLIEGNVLTHSLRGTDEVSHVKLK